MLEEQLKALPAEQVEWARRLIEIMERSWMDTHHLDSAWPEIWLMIEDIQDRAYQTGADAIFCATDG